MTPLDRLTTILPKAVFDAARDALPHEGEKILNREESDLVCAVAIAVHMATLDHALHRLGVKVPEPERTSAWDFQQEPGSINLAQVPGMEWER